MIGAREISEYAQKYNMKLGKDTPLSMEWCFKMADKAYEKGKQDSIKDTELFREIFLENLVQQSVDREEAIMYRDICTMSWNKYLEQLKECKNENDS